MKYYYLVGYKNTIKGVYPVIKKVSECDNIVNIASDLNACNIFTDKIKACEVYLQWIADYHKNGLLSCYFYDLNNKNDIPYLLKYNYTAKNLTI